MKRPGMTAMTYRVQKQGADNDWSLAGVYRSLSAAVVHCESAAAVAGDCEESTFLIATETDGGLEFVMLLENGRLVHAGQGWESVVPEAV
ncbi:hypothetical protein OAG01_00415 [bacterium]|nr:hypothetical protein [bacterium]MDA7668679.1 hypothetical protein [bacterium]MDB4632888.1 hypothetical protein [bacterium]